MKMSVTVATKIEIRFGDMFSGLVGVATIVTALACTQILDHSVPHSELNGLIYTGQLIIVIPFVIGYKKCDVRVERTSIGWLILGFILGTASTYGHYGVVYYLPLGVSIGISHSLVLIVNYIISCMVNRTVMWHKLCAVIMCCAGVAMVTQPLFESQTNIDTNRTYHSPCHVSNTHNFSTTDSRYADTKYSQFSSKDANIGYGICVAVGLITVANMHVVKYKLSNFDIFVYNFWASIFGLTSSFCIMATTETPFFSTVTICIMLLLATIFTAGLSYISNFRAYQLLDPVIAALIQTLEIALIFILQYTILSSIHSGHSAILETCGVITIVIGNALVPTYRLIHICLKKRGLENYLNS